MFALSRSFRNLLRTRDRARSACHFVGFAIFLFLTPLSHASERRISKGARSPRKVSPPHEIVRATLCCQGAASVSGVVCVKTAMAPIS